MHISMCEQIYDKKFGLPLADLLTPIDDFGLGSSLGHFCLLGLKLFCQLDGDKIPYPI